MAKRKKTCSDNKKVLLVVVAVAAFILGFLVARSYDADAVYYDSEGNWLPGMHEAMPYYDQFGNSYWVVPAYEGTMHAAPMYEERSVQFDENTNSFLDDGPVMRPVYDNRSNSYWNY